MIPTRDEVLTAIREHYGVDDLARAKATVRLVEAYLDATPEAALDLELAGELEGFYMLVSAIEGVRAREAIV
jgi:hypothetical protein